MAEGKRRKKNDEAIEKVARNLRIGEHQRHIFLCVDPEKPKCCDREDGRRSWKFLKKRLRELQLDTRLHAEGARDDHPGTPDRRPAGAGIRLRQRAAQSAPR